ncbi:MAG: hypothetical protein ABI083_14810 [Lapillicoccus sp.]
MVDIVIRALPYFWVGFVIVVALALAAARHTARLLRGSSALSFLFIAAAGGVLILTLLPTIGSGGSTFRCASFELPPDFLSQLSTVTVESLNLVLFIPVSFLAVFVTPRVIARSIICASVVVAAPLIETVQFLFPELRGSCFQLTTVVANEIGVGLGFMAAAITFLVQKVLAGTPPENL